MSVQTAWSNQHTSSSGTRWTSPLRVLGVAILSLSLSACNGGGVLPSADTGNNSSSGGSNSGGGSSVSQSPYLLYASNYVTYSQQTNGAYLHSIQGGDVYTGFNGASTNNGTGFNYGCYSLPQNAIDAQQLYMVQTRANGILDGSGACSAPSSGTAPTAATDNAYVSIKSPGSGNLGTVPPFDISQAGNLLIQMGNTYNASYNSGMVGGNAKVFTVEMSDAADANPAHATNDCSVNITLRGVGANIFTPTGAANYEIPLTAAGGWTCVGSGSLTGLMSAGVTAIAVKIIGSNNPGLQFGEFDTIAVGYIGFTK